MTTFNFECDCKQKFSIDADTEHSNKLNEEFKRGIRCPKCDEKWGEGKVVQVVPVTGRSKTDLSKARKSNKAASADAEQKAAQWRTEHPNENVTIERPKGMENSKYGNQTESVPKSVIDSLEERSTKIIEE